MSAMGRKRTGMRARELPVVEAGGCCEPACGPSTCGSQERPEGRPDPIEEGRTWRA